MSAVVVIAAFLLIAILVILLVRKTTVLENAAAALRAELRGFKEGGFSHVIEAEVGRITAKALESRSELVEQQRLATQAAQEFNQGLGTVRTQIDTLTGLQGKIDELNNLLKPQQLRGELGEVIIRALIADKLPPSQYEEDYAFQDGKKVEFVIRLNGKLIPVDSKLQLEDFKRMREAPEEQRSLHRTAFKRNVKQKIDEVNLYIKPQEGTYPFALMAIPSEAVYYDIISHRDFTDEGGLYDYARARNVFLVSPVTFWAYITAIAQGLQGLEIGRRAEEILAGLQTLASHIRSFSSTEFRVLGDQLRNAAKNYDEAGRKLVKIEGDLDSLERLEPHQQSQEVTL